MNELELWNLNEVKELLYFTSPINFIFFQEHTDLDAVDHCLIKGDFGLVTQTLIIENPEGNYYFRLSFSVEFYCFLENLDVDDLEDVEDEKNLKVVNKISNKKIEIYEEVSEKVNNIRCGIGNLPLGLKEWDFGDEDETPLISSVINTIDGHLGMVKISQEYQLNHYSPFEALPI